MTARRKFLYLTRRVGVLVGRIFWDEPPSKAMLLHAGDLPVVWSTELLGDELEAAIDELILGYQAIELETGAAPASRMATAKAAPTRDEQRKVGWREQPFRTGQLVQDPRPALDQLAEILAGSQRHPRSCPGDLCRRADSLICADGECDIAAGIVRLVPRAGPPTPRGEA